MMGRHSYHAKEVTCTLTRSCYPKGYDTEKPQEYFVQIRKDIMQQKAV